MLTRSIFTVLLTLGSIAVVAREAAAQVIVGPRPVVVNPSPFVVTPAPVVVAPAPVVVAPRPVVWGRPAVGVYRAGYWGRPRGVAVYRGPRVAGFRRF